MTFQAIQKLSNVYSNFPDCLETCNAISIDLRNGRAKTFQLALLTYQSGFWASAPKAVIIFGEKNKNDFKQSKKARTGIDPKTFQCDQHHVRTSHGILET